MNFWVNDFFHHTQEAPFFLHKILFHYLITRAVSFAHFVSERVDIYYGYEFDSMISLFTFVRQKKVFKVQKRSFSNMKY